jgi:hypothetical protein
MQSPTRSECGIYGSHQNAVVQAPSMAILPVLHIPRPIDVSVEERTPVQDSAISFVALFIAVANFYLVCGGSHKLIHISNENQSFRGILHASCWLGPGLRTRQNINKQVEQCTDLSIWYPYVECSLEVGNEQDKKLRKGQHF